VERNNWHTIPKLITGITFFSDPKLFGLNREKKLIISYLRNINLLTPCTNAINWGLGGNIL